jgi:hypothetical protein
MSALLAAFALLAVALSFRLARLQRAHGSAMAELDEKVKELSLRLESTEQDVASALTQGGVAEALLLEKGIADEDDIEAAHRRVDGDSTSGYVRNRDGELH